MSLTATSDAFADFVHVSASPTPSLKSSGDQSSQRESEDGGDSTAEPTNEASPPSSLSRFSSALSSSKNALTARLYNVVRLYPSHPAVFKADVPIALCGEWTGYQKFGLSGEIRGWSARGVKGDASVPQHVAACVLMCEKAFVWFTYRRGFVRIPRTHYTSDAGWGCLLRSAQMMLAKTFMRVLGIPVIREEDVESPYSQYRRMLRWFADTTSTASPFSVHAMVAQHLAVRDASLGIEGSSNDDVGSLESLETLFMPTEVSRIVAKVVAGHEEASRLLRVTVAKDGTLARSQLFADVTPEHLASGVDRLPRSLLVLLPMRLGLSGVHEAYHQTIRSSFQFPFSVGIIGGRPGRAHYFVAQQGDSIIYFDPHLVQPAADPDLPFDHSPYECTTPQSMDLPTMDPSMCFGFLRGLRLCP